MPLALLGCYVGEATQHYRCAKVYICISNRVINTDSFRFHPYNNTPTYSLSESLTSTLQNLSSILTSKSIHPSLSSINNPQLKGINDFTQLITPYIKHDSAVAIVSPSYTLPRVSTHHPNTSPTPTISRPLQTHTYNLIPRSNGHINTLTIDTHQAQPQQNLVTILKGSYVTKWS